MKSRVSFSIWFSLWLGLLGVLSAAWPLEVKQLHGEKGTSAWLLEDHNTPIVSMRFAFAQGTAEEPRGQEGTSLFLSGLVDEGTRQLDGATFRNRMEDIGMRIGFEDAPDNLQGWFMAPKASIDDAGDLLKQALGELSLTKEPVERMRQFFVQREQSLDNDSQIRANRAGLEMVMPGHPYQRSFENAERKLDDITIDELRAAYRRIFSKRGLKVTLVGDLTETEAKALIDKTFGDLPDGEDPLPIPKVTFNNGPGTRIISADTAQTLIAFGGPALGPNDPDYHAQIIASNIALATLNQIARQERGLTYGVSYEVTNFENATLLVGRLRTANANAGAAVQAIREAFKLLRNPGPGQAQLEGTVDYLNGKFALGFDSGMDAANTLLDHMLRGFSSNYFNVRDDLLEKVTVADLQRVIAKVMDADKMVFVAVGKPEGITTP